MEDRITKTLALLLDGSWNEAFKLYHEIITDLAKKKSIPEAIQNTKDSQTSSKTQL